MDYVIKNHKKVYIKLNEKGSPVTCAESCRGLFEYSKARNILNSLPKTLKKLNFKVEAVPEIAKKVNKKELIKVLTERAEYDLSENITRWIEKFGACGDVFSEAKQRVNDIAIELENADKELLDILHIIEIEKPKDLYGGWKLYKRIKNNRKVRRGLKDELLIIENVLREIDPTYLRRDRIQKAIDGLFGRKYKFRIVEDNESADL